MMLGFDWPRLYIFLLMRLKLLGHHAPPQSKVVVKSVITVLLLNLAAAAGSRLHLDLPYDPWWR
jgi:hypothetical protein